MERVWPLIASVIALVIALLVFVCVGFAVFSSGATDYCWMESGPEWDAYRRDKVIVVQHRSFSADKIYVAPSYTAALDFASKVCPNLKTLSK
jgi:hypothetical protein